MRYQGKITNWKDDKGFGFISPKDGGNPVFIHIKSFSNRKLRPVVTDDVTYELVTDQTGRVRAEKALFVDSGLPDDFSNINFPATQLLTIIFIVFVTALTFAGKISYAVPDLYLVTSIVALSAYALDKSAAQSNRWRTPEHYI